MEYLIQDSTLSGIADAIRAKTGTSEPFPVSSMATMISGIETGNSVDYLAEYLAGSISSYVDANGTIASVPNSAFAGCSMLEAIDLKSATYIGSSAFMDCASLAFISLSNVQSIGSFAFASCSSLVSVYIQCGNSSPTIPTTYSDAFYNTPIENSAFTGSFGSIFVPESMVESFKTAAGWSVYASRITAFQGD